MIKCDGSVFTTTQTITLTSTLVLGEAAGPEEIQGPGENLLTISGDGAVRVFQVHSGVTAILSGLAVSNGLAVNGGVEYTVMLTITNCTFDSNVATNDGGNIHNPRNARR